MIKSIDKEIDILDENEIKKYENSDNGNIVSLINIKKAIKILESLGTEDDDIVKLFKSNTSVIILATQGNHGKFGIGLNA